MVVVIAKSFSITFVFPLMASPLEFTGSSMAGFEATTCGACSARSSSTGGAGSPDGPGAGADVLDGADACAFFLGFDVA